MKRSVVALGILGLICAAALPASAQKEITLLGQKYSVVAQQRGSFPNGVKYKNGISIRYTDNGNRYSFASFSEGADRASDRLWFAARITIADNDDGTAPTGDQLYYLQGSDDQGQFTPAVSSATSFFGGNVDRFKGGRPVSVLEINRIDTGVKKDRNVIATTFWDDDAFRIYDIDSMQGARDTDAVFSRVHPGQGVAAGDAGDLDADENLPTGAFPSFAHLPTPDGKTVLVAAGPHGDSTGTGIGMWDTSKDAAHPVLTDLGDQTKSDAKPLPIADADGASLTPIAIARYGSGGEYLLLLTNPNPGGDDNSARTATVLVKMKLTLPADPSKVKAGDIKAQVLDSTDVNAAGKDILFPADTAGVTSIAVGRPLTEGGPPVLYTTDFDGNFYTLTPKQ